MVAATMSIDLDPETAEAVAEASPEERKKWALLLTLRLRELTSLTLPSLQTVRLPADTVVDDLHRDDLHWENLDYEPVPLQPVGQVTVRVAHRGKLKPMVHALDDE